MSVTQTLKEVVRAGLSKAGLYDPIRKAKGKKLDHLEHEQLQDRFAHIYRTGHWRLGKAQNPGSGAGSSLEATADLRRELPRLLQRIDAKTILDIGCGDFTWMKEVDLGGIDYIGADIVPGVVQENTERHGRDGVRFIEANALVDDLPDADVILAREVLFHLCFDDVRAALANMIAKPRRWLLITSDHKSLFNADIRSGDWRLLNLQIAPFHLPPPVHIIDDSRICPGRQLCTWRSEQIEQALRCA